MIRLRFKNLRLQRRKKEAVALIQKLQHLGMGPEEMQTFFRECITKSIILLLILLPFNSCKEAPEKQYKLTIQIEGGLLGPNTYEVDSLKLEDDFYTVFQDGRKARFNKRLLLTIIENQ